MHEMEQKYQAELDELKSTVEDQDSLLDRQSQQIQILYAKNTTLEEHLKQTTATLARLGSHVVVAVGSGKDWEGWVALAVHFLCQEGVVCPPVREK